MAELMLPMERLLRSLLDDQAKDRDEIAQLRARVSSLEEKNVRLALVRLQAESKAETLLSALREIRAAHVPEAHEIPDERGDLHEEELCGVDGSPWPCDTAVLIDEQVLS